MACATRPGSCLGGSVVVVSVGPSCRSLKVSVLEDSMNGKLVLPVGRNPQFISTCMGFLIGLSVLTRWSMDFKERNQKLKDAPVCKSSGCSPRGS